MHFSVLGYSLSQLLEYSFPLQSCAHFAFVWLHCMSGCSGVVMLRWYQRKGQCPLARLLAIFSVLVTLLGGLTIVMIMMISVKIEVVMLIMIMKVMLIMMVMLIMITMIMDQSLS